MDDRCLSATRLLAYPCLLKSLTSLSTLLNVDDHVGSLLTQLPELSQLTMHVSPSAVLSALLWLPQISNLRELNLLMRDGCELVYDNTSMLSSLQWCRGMTAHSLEYYDWICGASQTFQLTDVQLSALLESFPFLSSFHLHHARAIRSLQFLGAGSLPKTLKQLSLVDLNHGIDVAEMHHLTHLAELEDLHIGHRVFHQTGDPIMFAAFKVRIHQLCTKLCRLDFIAMEPHFVEHSPFPVIFNTLPLSPTPRQPMVPVSMSIVLGLLAFIGWCLTTGRTSSASM